MKRSQDIDLDALFDSLRTDNDGADEDDDADDWYDRDADER
ncbi:MAG TPA: hypothetical protein VF183_15475 [Acidimicrobiales bacterium]